MAECSLQTLAQLLNRSPRRIQQLVNDGVIPKPVVNGRYDLVKSVQAFIDYQDTLIKGQGSANLTKERERLTRLKADQEEIELKKARGEVISTDAAMKMWGEVIRIIRGQLLSLPGKTAPVLVGVKKAQEARDILEREVNGMCNELANPDLYMAARMASDKGRTRNIQAAAKVKGKRVGKRKKVSEPGE